MTVEQTEPTADETEPSPDILAVTDLVKHFPVRRGLLQRQVAAVQAVDGLTFSVRRGETLSLVGESGCGKTTTGRLLTRLLEPTGGRIVFKGRDITHLSASRMRPLRRDVQMIFQDPYSSLNPRHTVGTIVGAPFKLQRVHTEHGVKRAVQDLLELVGLNPEHYNRYPHEFSGGQRQRIGIARTLALKPKLIVADEPVSALDVSIQAQVINLLEDLQDELDLTYVIIAHDLSVVRHVSDRVASCTWARSWSSPTATDLYEKPMHPYTVALLSAVPIPDTTRRDQAGADPAAGRRAEPDQPAAGLPVPHPVLEGPGGVPARGAAAGGPRAGTPGGLPLPGEPARDGHAGQGASRRGVGHVGRHRAGCARADRAARRPPADQARLHRPRRRARPAPARRGRPPRGAGDDRGPGDEPGRISREVHRLRRGDQLCRRGRPAPGRGEPGRPGRRDQGDPGGRRPSGPGCAATCSSPRCSPTPRTRATL